jgi:hypothetical protein
LENDSVLRIVAGNSLGAKVRVNIG